MVQTFDAKLFIQVLVQTDDNEFLLSQRLSVNPIQTFQQAFGQYLENNKIKKVQINIVRYETQINVNSNMNLVIVYFVKASNQSKDLKNHSVKGEKHTLYTKMVKDSKIMSIDSMVEEGSQIKLIKNQ